MYFPNNFGFSTLMQHQFFTIGNFLKALCNVLHETISMIFFLLIQGNPLVYLVPVHNIVASYRNSIRSFAKHWVTDLHSCHKCWWIHHTIIKNNIMTTDLLRKSLSSGNLFQYLIFNENSNVIFDKTYWQLFPFEVSGLIFASSIKCLPGTQIYITIPSDKTAFTEPLSNFSWQLNHTSVFPQDNIIPQNVTDLLQA